MTKETVVFKNKKGKAVSFIKEQSEDEIVLIRNVRKESSLSNKKIIIHTIDLDKVKEFQNTIVDIPSNRGVVRKFVKRISERMGMNPVANNERPRP